MMTLTGVCGKKEPPPYEGGPAPLGPVIVLIFIIILVLVGGGGTAASVLI